jgi:FtsP/CotA-like multicopper oxidase with cupredoxin domain
MEFLGIGAGAAAGAALAGSAMGTFLITDEAQAVTTSVRLTPFLDELPIPRVLTGASQSLSLSQTRYFFHDRWKNAPIPVWGYNDGVEKKSGYLGPTIVAERGTPTTVTYANALPTKHLLNVDPTLMQMKGKPVNSRILTHLHGGHIGPLDDGNPYAGGKLPNDQVVDDFRSGQTQKAIYRNDQEAALIWYHDHALGITRLNVMAGLAGAYLVRDSVDNGEGGDFSAFGGGTLPSGPYEVPLVIQDRAFAKDGRIKYPAQWTPEFFGDVVCVNGKVWPFKNVEARKYRMRILNGSNSRFYNLSLTGGATMTQIGTDGGFLFAPVTIDSLLIAPGERADVIFDFTGTSANVHLIDTALPPTTVSPSTPLRRSEIMRFVVGATVSVPDGPLPTQLRQAAYSVPGTVAQERFLTLEERLAGPVPTALVLNGMRFGEVDAQGNRIVTERPNFGETEVWTLINVSADSHPMHLHLPQFEVLERRQLDAAGYQTALNAARTAAGGPVDADSQLVNPDPTPYLVGAPEPVDDNEKGPKDTVRANPAQITKIKVNFDIAGKYVWHCHILEHEENDMMRPYEVV